MPDFRDTAYL